MRIERDNSILNRLSSHLYYEFWMFGEALRLLSYARGQQDTNVAIESFGIHARVLVDFLFKPSGSNTDVLALDFLDDENSWLEFIDDKKEIYEYVRLRTGKEIAHLTTNRLDITPDDKKWDCIDIHKKITELFIEFLKRVPDERIEPKLIEMRS